MAMYELLSQRELTAENPIKRSDILWLKLSYMGNTTTGNVDYDSAFDVYDVMAYGHYIRLTHLFCDTLRSLTDQSE